MDHTASITRCHVRPYWKEDYQVLREIELSSFGPTEWLLDTWVRLATSASHSCFVDVAVVRERVVGYIAWAREFRDNPMSNTPELVAIMSLAVEPSWRGRRIGEQLLRRVEEDSRKFEDAEFISLHVRKDNPQAQRLYVRFGFRRIAIVTNYYGDCDAWVMKRELPRAHERQVSATHIAELVSLGFARDDVERSLRWTWSNVNLALDLLTGDVPVLSSGEKVFL